MLFVCAQGFWPDGEDVIMATDDDDSFQRALRTVAANGLTNVSPSLSQVSLPFSLPSLPTSPIDDATTQQRNQLRESVNQETLILRAGSGGTPGQQPSEAYGSFHIPLPPLPAPLPLVTAAAAVPVTAGASPFTPFIDPVTVVAAPSSGAPVHVVPLPPHDHVSLAYDRGVREAHEKLADVIQYYKENVVNVELHTLKLEETTINTWFEIGYPNIKMDCHKKLRDILATKKRARLAEIEQRVEKLGEWINLYG